MPQDPAERVDAAARGPRVSVPGARGARGAVLPPGGRASQTPLPSLQALRRLLQEHAHGDGEEGGDPDTLGHRYRRICRREWGTC